MRRFLEEKSPVGEVRRLMETAEGYEPARVEAALAGAGLPGVAIRRRTAGRASASSSSASCSRRWAARSCARRTSRRSRSRANAVLNAGTRRRRRRSCRGSRGRDARDARRRGAERALGRGRDRARGAAERWRLDAPRREVFVVDGASADLWSSSRARPARAQSGLSLFTCARREGCARRALHDDRSDPQARATRFGRARRARSARSAPAAPPLAQDARPGGALLANEQVGGAQKLLEMTVDYAKARVQFGRPIGSFQAIKHKCADMLLALELARSAAYYRGGGRGRGREELPAAASLAKALGSDAYLADRGRGDPDPRRARLHLGAGRAPLLQAREGERGAARRSDATTASGSRSVWGL